MFKVFCFLSSYLVENRNKGSLAPVIITKIDTNDLIVDVLQCSFCSFIHNKLLERLLWARPVLHGLRHGLAEAVWEPQEGLGFGLQQFHSFLKPSCSIWAITDTSIFKLIFYFLICFY